MQSSVWTTGNQSLKSRPFLSNASKALSTWRLEGEKNWFVVISFIYSDVTHSFLGCRGVPGEDVSILVVSQWTLFTREGGCKGLVVSVNDPARGSHFTHVKERVPSWVHGGCWLHPSTGSLTQPRAWICTGDVHAHVVDSLCEGPILVAVAGVFPCCEGHGCLPHRVPVAKVLKEKSAFFYSAQL